MRKNRILYLTCLFLVIGISFAHNRTLAYKQNYEISLLNFPYDRNWESISLIYPDKYHTPDELIEELEQVNNTAPGIVDLFSIGNSVEGRKILCVRITNENNTGPKTGTLIIGQHHAREQITVEMALRFILHLVNEYGTNNAISELIDIQEIYIIPTLNPDGLHYVVGNETMAGDPWLRKNARQIDDDGDGLVNEDPPEDLNGDGIVSGYDVYTKIGDEWGYAYSYWEGNDTDKDGQINEDPFGGVDLNRNYAYRWNDSRLDSGWGSDTTSQVYPGTAPFSEPETAALKGFLEGRSFATSMSLHSGINQSYFAWGSTGVWAENKLYTSIYNGLRINLPLNYLAYINDGYGIGYTIAGDWADWMYTVKKCLVPMTFEIYHNRSVDLLEQIIQETSTQRIVRFDGIFGYFNPIESYIDSLWEDLQSSFEYWVEITPRLLVTNILAEGGNATGESLTIGLTIKNLSPYVPTIDGLTVVDESLNNIRNIKGLFVSVTTLGGATTEDLSFQIRLEEDLAPDKNLTFLIGNRFAGYSTFIIRGEMIMISNSTRFDVITVIAAFPLGILIKHRFRRKNSK